MVSAKQKSSSQLSGLPFYVVKHERITASSQDTATFSGPCFQSCMYSTQFAALIMHTGEQKTI